MNQKYKTNKEYGTNQEYTDPKIIGVRPDNSRNRSGIELTFDNGRAVTIRELPDPVRKQNQTSDD